MVSSQISDGGNFMYYFPSLNAEIVNGGFDIDGCAIGHYKHARSVSLPLNTDPPVVHDNGQDLSAKRA